METERSHMTERILNLTLEIIYLLTGEECIIVKKPFDDHITCVSQHWSRKLSPMMEPPTYSLISEINNGKKILEVIKKIIELLTGEVPIRCQDVTVYFSMEEWKYIEGHKDLYKDVMMENRPPLTSPDGSSNGNPPERCPRPLYSRDSIQEHQEIPQEDQEESLIVVKVEDEEDLYVMGDESCKDDEIPPEIPPEISTDPGDTRDTRRDISIGEEEEAYVRIKGKDIPIDINTNGQHIRNHMKDLPIKYISPNALGENPIIPNLHPALPSTALSSDPCKPGGSFYDSSAPITHHTDKRVCYVCGTFFTRTETLTVHQRSYTGEKPCSVCGKCFLRKLCFINQERSHTEEKPYVCSECGKCFNQKSNLTFHQRIHTGEKPFSCSQCGKCFNANARLLQHQRTHTGVKPYSCSECGKCFTESSALAKHKRIHTGEKPYSCSECGKCFTQGCHLELHKRTHTGQKPYSCSECGKCFTTSSALVNHRRIHTGEKPYSCSDCEKCFTRKKNLLLHQRVHTG